jgi:hypothetical protein
LSGRSVLVIVDTFQVPNSEPDFDLDCYIRLAGATRPDAFDWSTPGSRLNEDALFCLGYMRFDLGLRYCHQEVRN